jgi:hypothetical protein
MSDTSACNVVRARDIEDDDPPEMVKFVQELTRSRPKSDREQEIEAGSLVNMEFDSHRRDEEFDDSPSDRRDREQEIEAGSLVQKQFALPAYPHSEESCTNDNVEFASHRRDDEFDDSDRRDREQGYGSPSKKMKKMKKGTICPLCEKEQGSNLSRHMMTHLPDDSPVRIAHKAKINPIQAAWHKGEYHNNPEFEEREKLRSVTHNENNRLGKIGLPPVEDGWTPDLSKRRRKKHVELELTPGSECQYYSDEDEFPVE